MKYSVMSLTACSEIDHLDHPWSMTLDEALSLTSSIEDIGYGGQDFGWELKTSPVRARIMASRIAYQAIKAVQEAPVEDEEKVAKRERAKYLLQVRKFYDRNIQPALVKLRALKDRSDPRVRAILESGNYKRLEYEMIDLKLERDRVKNLEVSEKYLESINNVIALFVMPPLSVDDLFMYEKPMLTYNVLRALAPIFSKLDFLKIANPEKFTEITFVNSGSVIEISFGTDKTYLLFAPYAWIKETLSKHDGLCLTGRSGNESKRFKVAVVDKGESFTFDLLPI